MKNFVSLKIKLFFLIDMIWLTSFVINVEGLTMKNYAVIN